MSQFSTDIKKFNGIYKLPVNTVPTLDYLGQALDEREAAALRLGDFKNIIAEEIEEVEDIINGLRTGLRYTNGLATQEVYSNFDALTDLTDWLGDIQVFSASEMVKFGLPLDQTLELIMQSNFSKLGADGNPIYDDRGKVLKGPNYWKPEPKLRKMLEALEKESLKNMSVAEYRKKPVVISAIQWTGNNFEEVQAFTGICAAMDANELVIYTLEDGTRGQAKHAASIGDFVIRGVQGEFYFCKPDIFASTYEPA